MPAVTPEGTPYALPDDDQETWPPISLQVAELIDANRADIEATLAAGKPFGSISSGAASQSLGAGTTTKLTLFAGATPTLQGGMQWNATEHRFTGPPGYYLIHLSLRVLTVSAASVITGYSGSATATGRGLFSHSLAASAAAFSPAGGAIDTEDRLAAWIGNSAARAVDYARLDVMFLSPR